MSVVLEFFISLFQFSPNALLNSFISIGIGYLGYKISYFAVGIIGPILLFCGPIMSIIHWIIRIGIVLTVIYCLTQLKLWISIPIAVIGFACMLRKIF